MSLRLFAFVNAQVKRNQWKIINKLGELIEGKREQLKISEILYDDKRVPARIIYEKMEIQISITTRRSYSYSPTSSIFLTTLASKKAEI